VMRPSMTMLSLVLRERISMVTSMGGR
jgi:hypothetical protein